MAIDASGRNLFLGAANSTIARFDLTMGLPGASVQVATPVGTVSRMAAHPSDYLYAVPQGPGDQTIYAYRIDADTGALAPVAGSPYRLGFGPTNLSAVNMAVDPLNDRLYVTASDDALYSYRIGGAGDLALTQGLGTANGGAISASSSGRYVFVGGDNNFGNGRIHVYRVNADGSLTEIVESPLAVPVGNIYDVKAVTARRLP
jgi:6-phosphogluconolactonase (cycloisomerase 2 family)